MKVASKLVNMDFSIGKIERNGEYLIIHGDPEKSSIPAKVRLDAEDIWSFLKAALKWQVIGYILTFPFLYRNAKEANRKVE
jgi:murein L,D-transpeptidase YafK